MNDDAYVVKVPGNLYRTVMGLGILDEDASPAVKAAWEAATARPIGRGVTYFITGPAETLRGVLAVLVILITEIDQGLVRAYEIGVDLAELRRVSQQSLTRRELTTRELSARVRRVPVRGSSFNDYRRYPASRNGETNDE